MERQTIILGDLTQKFSLSLFDQLSTLLHLMPTMDPELRANKLRKHSAIARKTIESLLSVCRLLRQPQFRAELKRIQNLEEEASLRGAHRDRTLDALYFFHAGLYPNRIWPFDIHSAKEILRSGKPQICILIIDATGLSE